MPQTNERITDCRMCYGEKSVRIVVDGYPDPREECPECNGTGLMAEPESQCCGWPIDEDSRCLKCHQRTGALTDG